MKKLKKKLVEMGKTPFAVDVLLETVRIPKGQISSYSEIARAVGRPRAARAVGSVLRHNPFPFPGPIPCHRVIHKDGNLAGFFGSTDPQSRLNAKKRSLLRKEKALTK